MRGRSFAGETRDANRRRSEAPGKLEFDKKAKSGSAVDAACLG